MGFYGISDGDRAQLEREVLALFVDLLQTDTTNPPGNETPCSEVLARYLRDNGIACELCGESAERQNVVARVRGRRAGATLLMMGHMDVVPADAAEWSVPPFAGTVADGYVWGCGAVDMKNQLAAEAVALARLARSRADFAGEVVFAATVDEELGEHCGVRWLCRHRPELVRCDYLVNEGMGGLWLPAEGKKVFLLAVGEKAFLQFRLCTRGRGGHASVPEHDHSAVIDLARAVAAIGACQPPATIDELTKSFIDRIVTDAELRARLKDPERARAAVGELRARDPAAAGLVEPLLGTTFTPTVLRAGAAVNVIPTHAEAEIDCRVMPGTDETAVRGLVAALLDPLAIDWELEWVDTTTPNSSPANSPLRDSIERVLRADVPQAILAPMVAGSFTDSRHFREFFPDTVAYGFAPFVHESLTDMDGGRDHSPDERVLVDDVLYQTLFFERLARDLLQ